MHKGETGAFVWALKSLDSTLKIAPFIVETDSMSVKYIRTLKIMEGVYVRWSEIIEEFTFVVIHAKVIVEDCISRDLRHLQEPTKEDLQLEQDYESDPEPMFDLEEIARREATLEDRSETMWHLDDEKELQRSSRTTKPTQRMEQSHLQEQMFRSRMSQGGGKKEKQNGGWTVVRDNQLPERREVRGEVEQPSTLEMEVEADGAVEKGLEPTDALLRAGDPYKFQPLP